MTLLELLLMEDAVAAVGQREPGRLRRCRWSADDGVVVVAAHFDAVAKIAADDRGEAWVGRADGRVGMNPAEVDAPGFGVAERRHTPIGRCRRS